MENKEEGMMRSENILSEVPKKDNFNELEDWVIEEEKSDVDITYREGFSPNAQWTSEDKVKITKPIIFAHPSLTNNDDSQLNTQRTLIPKEIVPSLHNPHVIDISPLPPRRTLSQVIKSNKKTTKQGCKIFCVGLMATIYVNNIYICYYRYCTHLLIYSSCSLLSHFI